MSKPSDKSHGTDETRVLHLGRSPEKQYGFVNPGIYRGSTVIFPTLQSLRSADQEFVYGRNGTPTIRYLEDAIAALEGGVRTVLTPSGLSAISVALLAFVKSGDHILVSDSVYRPTRRFCDKVLGPLGVETTYYDPLIGADIAALIQENTRLVFTETPGSQTFEMQDIPAISDVAHRHGALVVLDNTWASPLYFKPFDHGVDVSVQAATKYIVGHSDAMLGAVTANERTVGQIKAMHDNLGLCPGPEDASLGLRGLRTMAVRLERHWQSGLDIARWLQARPEVARVLHPALEGDPGYEIWKRDFAGASGLFSIILHPVSDTALAAFLDHLELFGMGYSWGGYESLIIPFDPSSYRTATSWSEKGPALRLHIGLDNVEDLKCDLSEGFARMSAAS